MSDAVESVEASEEEQSTEELEEKAPEKEEPELDLSNPHVLKVMRAFSIETQQLILTNGVVYQVLKPWPGPDGNPIPLSDKEGKPILDENNQQRYLLVGAIFFIEEVATTSQDEDEDGDTSMITTRNPAHYEVWTEPGPMMRRKRIALDQVVEDESAVPADWAADQVMTERLPAMLVLDVDEVVATAKRLAEQNGAAST